MSTAQRRLTLRFRSLLGEHRRRRGRSARVSPGFIGEHFPSQQTVPAGPYVTISVGGPLDGIVTLTATDSGRVVVDATWRGSSARHHISLTRPGEREALILADSWSNQLMDGHGAARDVVRQPRWG